MFEFPAGLRFPQDIIDIVLVAFVIYRILLLIKGTRAFQILVGIVVIAGAYAGGQFLELFTLNWILNAFLSSFIIVLVILFQNDIRRALAHMGKHPLWDYTGNGIGTAEVIEELMKASVALSNKKIGALIVVERETRLRDYVEGGVLINGVVSRELLQSIFLPYSPIHDGAVIVGENRVVWSGCFLPLTSRVDLEKDVGTRHRAALGITEETDAVAIVVSEETSAISVVINGRITRNLDGPTLRRVLLNLFTGAEKPRKPAVGKKFKARERAAGKEASK